MQKEILSVSYQVSENKGAKFIYNNNPMNKGELIETAIANLFFGLINHKKDCARFDVASDIETAEHGYSVKSYKASLTELVTTAQNDENGKQEIINEFMSRVHSDRFIYANLHENLIEFFIMNSAEFEDFLSIWTLDKQSKVNETRYKLRCKRGEKIILKYLNERISD